MVSISESSSAVLGLSVNAYNSGVGGAIDMLIVKPLQFFDIVYRALVPLYNAVMFIVSHSPPCGNSFTIKDVVWDGEFNKKNLFL